MPSDGTDQPEYIDRLVELRGTNFMETHHGLKYECQNCYRHFHLAQAIDGHTCNCGREFGPVFLNCSETEEREQ